MKYLQSVFCWLGIGLIGGMIFLVLQQTSSVPITWVRLSLLAVPASYTAIGLFCLILDGALGNFPAEDKNYQWLVYFYPLLFLINLSIIFSAWFLRVLFEIITGRNNKIHPSIRKLTAPLDKVIQWQCDKLDGK